MTFDFKRHKNFYIFIMFQAKSSMKSNEKNYNHKFTLVKHTWGCEMRKTNIGILLVSSLATANAFSEVSFDDFKANWKFSGTMKGNPVGFQSELTDFYFDDSSWQSVDISTDYVPDSSRMYWFVRKKFYLEAGSITFSGRVDDDEIWTLIAPNGEYTEIGGDANDNDGLYAHRFTHTFTVTSPGFYIWAGRGHEGGGGDFLSILRVTGLELINNNKPNLVTLNNFTATLSQDNIRVHWETASEVDNAGFYLWRAIGEGWKEGDYSQVIRITDQLIPSKGTKVGGYPYSYVDSNVESGITYYYGLEDIDFNGQSTVHFDFIDEATAK
jgi:hypothetical protein